MHALHTPPLNILLVEDSRVHQILGVRLLEKAGHTVTLVEDGLAAIKATANEDYDLVLMDVEMPRMTAWRQRARFAPATRQVAAYRSSRSLPQIAALTVSPLVWTATWRSH